MAKRNTKAKINIDKVWLETPVELARLACNFSVNNNDLLSYREGKNTVLMLPYDRIGDTVIAYCALSEVNADIISYQNSDSETINFEKVEKLNSYFINVIETDKSAFKEKKLDARKVNVIRLERYEDIIRGLVKKSVEDDRICNAFIFNDKGKTVMFAFDLFENLSENKVLFYAVSSRKITGCFARYKYNDNTIDFSDSMDDHIYMYVKLIYLKKSPGFLHVLSD
jgi:hypothetical protein